MCIAAFPIRARQGIIRFLPHNRVIFVPQLGNNVSLVHERRISRGKVPAKCRTDANYNAASGECKRASASTARDIKAAALGRPSRNSFVAIYPRGRTHRQIVSIRGRGIGLRPYNGTAGENDFPPAGNREKEQTSITDLPPSEQSDAGLCERLLYPFHRSAAPDTRRHLSNFTPRLPLAPPPLREPRIRNCRRGFQPALRIGGYASSSTFNFEFATFARTDSRSRKVTWRELKFRSFCALSPARLAGSTARFSARALRSLSRRFTFI